MPEGNNGKKFMHNVRLMLEAWTGGQFQLERRPGKGDLVGPVDFPFLVECKDQRTWKLDHFLKGNVQLGKPSPVAKYLLQVLKDCRDADHVKAPLLILTKPFSPIYVCTFLFIFDCMLLSDNYTPRLEFPVVSLGGKRIPFGFALFEARFIFDSPYNRMRGFFEQEVTLDRVRSNVRMLTSRR